MATVTLKPLKEYSDYQVYEHLHATAENIDQLDSGLVTVQVRDGELDQWLDKFQSEYDDGSGTCQRYELVSVEEGSDPEEH